MKRLPVSFTVEVKRSWRKEPPVAPPVLSEAVTGTAASTAEMLPDLILPKGRILPSLEEPRSSPSSASTRRRKTYKAARTPEFKRDPERVVDAATGEIEPISMPQPVATDPVLAPRRRTHRRAKEAKLPRASFWPGERWKHRLPAAVHRSMRRLKKD